MTLRQFSPGYYKQFIPKDGIPERVYKYCSLTDHLKNSLSESYLWFSKPLDFNDPFDCYSALVDFKNPEDHVKALVADRLQHLPRNQRRAEGRAFAKKIGLVSAIYQHLTEQSISNMGVCCFTSKNDHVLMWSHYAGNHKGLCLVFDPLVDLAYFSTAEVIYIDVFQPVNYFQNKEDALMIMAVTKSKDWAYESELRVILPNSNGRQYFNKAALTGIIFGCRTSESDINKVKQIVDSADYGAIKYQQACMGRNNFQLSITDI
jgi:hypothetical protein